MPVLHSSAAFHAVYFWHGGRRTPSRRRTLHLRGGVLLNDDAIDNLIAAGMAIAAW